MCVDVVTCCDEHEEENENTGEIRHFSDQTFCVYVLCMMMIVTMMIDECQLFAPILYL